MLPRQPLVLKLQVLNRVEFDAWAIRHPFSGALKVQLATKTRQRVAAHRDFFK